MECKGNSENWSDKVFAILSDRSKSYVDTIYEYTYIVYLLPCGQTGMNINKNVWRVCASFISEGFGANVFSINKFIHVFNCV